MKNEHRRIYLVSSCLMGLRTRYDGTTMPSEECRRFMDEAICIPVCPEQLGGLPTPRPPAEIRGGDGKDVLAGKARVSNCDNLDVTAEFISGARQVLFLAEEMGADGALFKSRSPSCGCGEVLGVTAALLKSKGYSVREL